MAIADLGDWMDDNTGPHIIWYVKRLSANDTLANGSHQAGPYVPKTVLFDIFPSLNKPAAKDPDAWFDLHIDSHSGDTRKVRAVWYNNKYRGKTRDEARLTNFGGKESALLDPESTGALAVFSFHRDSTDNASVCHVWVCDTEVEADLVEERIGPVDPGEWKLWSVDRQERDLFLDAKPARSSCWMGPDEIPPGWLVKFPSTMEIIQHTLLMRPSHGIQVDKRLMKRRECEFEIFRSVEQAVELPQLRKGFSSVEDFVSRAQTILQRRKSRSGRSLELHAKEIFVEERLLEGVDFQHQPESEPGKSPDFLFPNESSYKDMGFSPENLRMLAVKTTCKDRWRQILNEANRIDQKHLLTLQAGVSEGQFREMSEANVRLVVPEPLVSDYPKSVRPHLQTLESFIGDIRLLNISRKPLAK
ncbi:MAG: type II restriction endonuclease [Rhodospirillales bacterium]|nr:type II restriction endonuclease [Rhodospirillales bacterium]